MSYSFAIKGASKDEAGKLVEEQLGQVVATQPVHERDRQLAQDTAESCINTLADPGEGEVVRVNVSGSLGWRGESDSADFQITSANVSVHADLWREPTV